MVCEMDRKLDNDAVSSRLRENFLVNGEILIRQILSSNRVVVEVRNGTLFASLTLRPDKVRRSIADYMEEKPQEGKEWNFQ